LASLPASESCLNQSMVYPLANISLTATTQAFTALRLSAVTLPLGIFLARRRALLMGFMITPPSLEFFRR
jgi:hypothetical protein